MRHTFPRSFLAFLIVLALASSACMAVTGALPTADSGAGLPPTSTNAPEPILPPTSAPALPTEAATPTAPAGTETAQPTVTAVSAATTTATPATAAPAFVLPSGMEIFSHSEIPGFVFPADPNRWQIKTDPNNPWAFLVHRAMPGCEIMAVPGRGIGTPNRLLRWQLGRLRWTVLDYDTNALVSIDKPAGLFLELHDFDTLDCRADQQAVMERVMLADEMNGVLAYDLLPTATARPPLPGFSCPNMPPARLRAGESAYIVTNDLILRSEPRASSSTVLRTYDATDPVVVQVIGGPVCTDRFVYWNVEVGLIGEGAMDTISGWFAEGDLREYYLEPAE